jgi:hypothetical protein
MNGDKGLSIVIFLRSSHERPAVDLTLPRGGGAADYSIIMANESRQEVAY